MNFSKKEKKKVIEYKEMWVEKEIIIQSGDVLVTNWTHSNGAKTSIVIELLGELIAYDFEDVAHQGVEYYETNPKQLKKVYRPLSRASLKLYKSELQNEKYFELIYDNKWEEGK